MFYWPKVLYSNNDNTTSVIQQIASAFVVCDAAGGCHGGCGDGRDSRVKVVVEQAGGCGCNGGGYGDGCSGGGGGSGRNFLYVSANFHS